MDGQRQTMAEMLKQLVCTPPPARGPLEVLDTRHGVGLPGPDGESFDRVQNDISPADAVALLHSGALVAWDPCGCGGYCAFDWLDTGRRRTLLTADRPKIGGRAKKGRWGAMSHWRSPAGTDLLLAEFHVRWGTELA